MSGGLGSQIFRYAAARTICLKRGYKLKIDTNGRCYPNNRIYNLDKFDIKGEEAQIYNINKCNNIVRDSDSYLVDDSIWKTPFNSYLDGEFISYKYLCELKSYIKSDLKLRNPVEHYYQTPLKALSVSLSFRYFWEPNKIGMMHQLTEAYYKDALDYLHNVFPQQKFKFYVFSDNIYWTLETFRDLLNGLDFEVVSKNVYDGVNLLDYEELVCLSKCAHHILSNSAFSLCGAMLGENESSIVIRPGEWFGLSGKNPKDIFSIDYIIANDTTDINIRDGRTKDECCGWNELIIIKNKLENSNIKTILYMGTSFGYKIKTLVNFSKGVNRIIGVDEYKYEYKDNPYGFETQDQYNKTIRYMFKETNENYRNNRFINYRKPITSVDISNVDVIIFSNVYDYRHLKDDISSMRSIYKGNLPKIFGIKNDTYKYIGKFDSIKEDGQVWEI